MAFIQVLAKLKNKPCYDDRGLIAHNIKKHMAETGKAPSKRPVDVTIHVGYQYQHWKDAMATPAINPDTPLSVFGAIVAELQGVAFEDESQVVTLSVASFYRAEDSILVMVTER